MATSLEIEIDGPHNENLRFRPLQKEIRGRLDWTRIGDPEAHRIAVTFGGLPIPGQRIGFDDATGRGYVIDPLHDAEHAALVEKIKARGMRLPPAREEIEGADRVTWLYWMRQAVRCGLARIVAGKLPDDLDETKVRRDFIFAPKQPTPTDKLTAALSAQAAAFNRLADVLERSLTTIKR